MHMMDFILKKILHVKSMEILHIKPVHPKRAGKDISDIYSWIEAESILSPPITIHSASFPLLKAIWPIFRETFVVTTAVNKYHKESVALAVSESNTCPYCTEVHNVFISALRRIDNKRSGKSADSAPITNTDALMMWARNTRYRDSVELSNPPFTLQEAPEYIGIAILYHYTNRIINVFCNESGFTMKGIPQQANAAIRAISSRMMETPLSKEPDAGVSVLTLTDTRLPADMSWCNGNEYIAKSFIAFDAAIEDLVSMYISEDVLKYIDKRISVWDGTDPGLGTEWLQDIPADMSNRDQSIARLALVVAFASYRANTDIIEEAKAYLKDDEALLALVAWTSFRTAKLIGSWIPVPQA